ncbi:MAG: hypothetical protein OXR67_11270 [Chloroflexota bacterium]|nr:hypothetical protein [Chloroflexota bacterium]
MIGLVIGLSMPSALSIWRSLATLAHLSTTGPSVLGYGPDGFRIQFTLQAMVRDGLSAAFLGLLLVLLLPIIIRLLAEGGLSIPLSLALLVGPTVAMIIVGFRMHRVLEPAFQETFTGDEDAGVLESAEEEMTLPDQDREPLVVGVIEQMGSQGEVLQILERGSSQANASDETASGEDGAKN